MAAIRWSTSNVATSPSSCLSNYSGKVPSGLRSLKETPQRGCSSFGRSRTSGPNLATFLAGGAKLFERDLAVSLAQLRDAFNGAVDLLLRARKRSFYLRGVNLAHVSSLPRHPFPHIELQLPQIGRA